MLRKIDGHEDAVTYTLYAMLALIVLAIAFSGCKSAVVPPVETIIERATEAGTVAFELPSAATFDRFGLPSGVEAKDVAAIITLKDAPVSLHDKAMPGEVSFGNAAAGKGVFSKIAAAVAKKRKKAPANSAAENQVLVLKDGRVIAGKAAAEQIATAEKVKPSYAWAWWLLTALLALLAVAWAARSFEPAAKVVAAVIGIFRRK
jgi:hypothetical protein